MEAIIIIKKYGSYIKSHVYEVPFVDAESLVMLGVARYTRTI